jgi:hypothetical protein
MAKKIPNVDTLGDACRAIRLLESRTDDMRSAIDDALALGNGSHQQIADLNRAMVSTIAKADDALKASATALRSITELETQVGDIHRRIDKDSKTIASLILRTAQAERSISDEGQVRRNVEGIVAKQIADLSKDVRAITTGLLNAREDAAARGKFLEGRIDYTSERRQEAFTMLDNKIAALAADFNSYVKRAAERREGHAKRNADVEARLSSLEEELRGNKPRAVKEAGIAITERPHERRYLVIVLFDGGTVVGKSGFKNNDAAMKWFEGYVRRCREAFAHDPKRYTYIILPEMT